MYYKLFQKNKLPHEHEFTNIFLLFAFTIKTRINLSMEGEEFGPFNLIEAMHVLSIRTRHPYACFQFPNTRLQTLKP